MENITVGKWGGGCSTNGHMTVGKEGGDGLEGKGEDGGKVWTRGLSHGPYNFLKLGPLIGQPGL